ncbi:unnamed protein product [Bursaphelenchus okinawaensis]|uniref:Uncharacterized protein n=1 Tax=Bursaphelenchus okinawaensis TaxID=465554 RepID=A0A811K9X4_9BILA|nr:unnamed protein product [Bursaphelenchus okinawaensis]CAG9098003.1 unnamed protein product [Bursaphelenchus okinawaensis]
MGKTRRDPLKEFLLDVEEEDVTSVKLKHIQAKNQYKPLVITLSLLILTSCVLYLLITKNTPGDSITKIIVKTSPKKSDYFIRPVGTQDLRCDWVMDGKHDQYVKQLAGKRYRIEDPDSLDDLPMDCQSIKARHHFPDQPSSPFEADFPYAVARNVYKDYYYLELVLAATYQPQNCYCYAIDRSADHLFRARLKALAKCLPNVIVATEYRDMDSAGHRMDLAHIDCLNVLRNGTMKWKYVQLLQNHDFPAKTNYKMVAVMKWLNGSNDIEMNREPGRVNKKLNWTLSNMEIFKNSSKLDQILKTWTAPTPPSITFAKGYNEVTISREAIDYIFTELNLTKLFSQIDNDKTYGIDEIGFTTILSMELLGIPGHFSQHCINQGKSTSFITRYSNWLNQEKCKSHHFRHAICIHGVEDLLPIVDNIKELYVNKVMPDFDFNAVTCWLEVLYNRTYLEERTVKRLDQKHYQGLAHVRYQALKDENGQVPAEKLANFSCTA